LPKDFMLRASYQGSQSWHMYDTRDMNSAVYGTGATANNISQRRPWYAGGYGGAVYLNESANTSSFNALVVSVEKRMTGDLSLLGGYRWAKCLDVAGSQTTFSANEFTDPTNRMFDRGLCNSDISSQGKLALVYHLPALKSQGFVVRNVFGGWTMSGIWQWRNGFPFSVVASTDTNVDGASNRADLVGDPYLPGGRSRAEKVQQWFNPAAFQNGAAGTLGTSPRNFLRGPGYFDLDYSLIKSFPIRYGPLKETQKIDFRAEFFNIFNHTNFNNPVSGLADPVHMGQIQSARDPRIIQFALKYVF
jgi:hypothetical protein